MPICAARENWNRVDHEHDSPLSGERTRPRVLISAPRRNPFESRAREKKFATARAPSPAREARALPRLKRAAFLLIFAFVSLTPAIGRADEEESSNTKPDAGGIVIEPNQGNISPGNEITITFPVAMVPADRIDVADQPPPFASNPKLEGTFLWKSQTEGVFVVRAVVPGAHHRLTLVPKLADAMGKSIDAQGWSAEFTAPRFSISSDFDAREHLSAQPQIGLDSNYDVKLTEVAEHVYFQDRDSHARFPVNVIQSSDENVTKPPIGRSFRVTPRAPLPVGRTYDLVVNGLVEAKSRRPLQYLKSFPGGKNRAIKDRLGRCVQSSAR